MLGKGVGVLCVVLTLAGCKGRTAAEKPVGGDLPVSSPNSVALPGATDAADAPHAPAVAESHDATLTAWSDPATGVRFDYPSVWRPNNAAMGAPAPEFTSVAGAPRITQVFLPKGNYYEPTVLQSLSFSYAMMPHSTAAACAALPAKALQDPAVKRSATYDGVTYAEAGGSDAGACHQVVATIDTTLRGTQCLVFERDFSTICPYVKSQTLPRPLTTAETNALQRHLDAVMASVQVLPAK